MSSEIIFSTIDEKYPYPGIDNNTQGFRDNFSIIKQSLGTARAEVTDLQTNTAKLNQSNNFNGSEINNVQLGAVTEKFHAAGTLFSGQNISYLNGQYQTVFVVENITTISLTLSNWPDGNNRLATMRVELSCLENAEPATQVEWLTENAGQFRLETGFPDPFILTSVPKIVEFWTYNNGSTVYGRYLGEYPDV